MMQHDTQEAFRARFVFDPAKSFRVGVEREAFIVDATGAPVPRAPEVLRQIAEHAPEHAARFGYELSACQIEQRTEPLESHETVATLRKLRSALDTALIPLRLRCAYHGVGPPDMPTAVYPDPTGRYERISRAMPPEKLSAACRIIGTHIHIGMPDEETALRVYNGVIEDLFGLRIAADKTGGERLRLYRTVVEDPSPIRFESWAHFHAHALEYGYAHDPRSNWMLVRITQWGTIEFRLFDGTDSEEEIGSWCRECRAKCIAYA